MPDESTEAQTTGTAEPAPTDATLDLARVDPKALKAHVDREVTKAIKTREAALAAKADAEKRAKEVEAAKTREDFQELERKRTADIDALTLRALKAEVTGELRDQLREAGLIDMDDLRLLSDDAIDKGVEKDGTINKAAMAEVVDAFKKAKPHKFRDAQADAPRFRGAPTPAGAPSDPGAALPSPGTPGYYEHYKKQRDAQYERASKPPKRGGLHAILAQALRDGR
jgi:hypothetical protein